MGVDIEVKKEKAIENPADCTACGEPAKVVLTIGEIRNLWGDEYDLCGRKSCEAQAVDMYAEGLFDMRRNRKSYAQEDDFEFRKEA